MLRWRRCVAGAAGLGLIAGVLAVAEALPAGALPAGAPATVAPSSTVTGGQGFRAQFPARVLDTRAGLGAPKASVGTLSRFLCKSWMGLMVDG